MLESVREIQGHKSGSQLNNRVRNLRRIEMVSIQRIICETLQQLDNFPSQTGNFARVVAQQTCRTLFVSDMGLNVIMCLCVVADSVVQAVQV